MVRRLAFVLLLAETSAFGASAPKGTGPTLRQKIRLQTLKWKASAINAGGRLIGYAELAGLRYRVKPYQAKVSNALTRGSRLDAAQIDELKRKGYSGIVALTAESNSDAPAAQAAGLMYKRIPIIDNTPPTEKQVVEFLDFMRENSVRGPVYVHCEEGKGRTGVMVAAYRMAFEGWSAGQALSEARTFGLAMPDQRQFIRDLWRDLQSGRIPNYPIAD